MDKSDEPVCDAEGLEAKAVDMLKDVDNDSLVAVMRLDDDDAKVLTNASPEGYITLINQLMAQLGYAHALENVGEVKPPANDTDALLHGASVHAFTVKCWLDDVRKEREAKAHKPRHVKDDVSDGAIVKDPGKKTVH